MLAEAEIAKLAVRYGQAVDRLDAAALTALFAEDAVLEGPGWRYQGHAEIGAIIPIIAAHFAHCWHAVYDQAITVSGDTASGETYSTARHLLRGDDYQAHQVMSMTLRYRDQFRLIDGRWQYTRRSQLLDWMETATVQKLGDHIVAKQVA